MTHFTRLFISVLLLATITEAGKIVQHENYQFPPINYRLKRAARECDLDPKHPKISYFDVIYRYGRPFLMSCLMKKQGFDERDCKQWSCQWTGSWMEFHAWCRWTGTELCKQKYGS